MPMRRASAFRLGGSAHDRLRCSPACMQAMSVGPLGRVRCDAGRPEARNVRRERARAACPRSATAIRTSAAAIGRRGVLAQREMLCTAESSVHRWRRRFERRRCDQAAPRSRAARAALYRRASCPPSADGDSDLHRDNEAAPLSLFARSESCRRRRQSSVMTLYTGDARIARTSHATAAVVAARRMLPVSPRRALRAPNARATPAFRLS